MEDVAVNGSGISGTSVLNKEFAQSVNRFIITTDAFALTELKACNRLRGLRGVNN